MSAKPKKASLFRSGLRRGNDVSFIKDFPDRELTRTRTENLLDEGHDPGVLRGLVAPRGVVAAFLALLVVPFPGLHVGALGRS